jgi:hypothetical protein
MKTKNLILAIATALSLLLFANCKEEKVEGKKLWEEKIITVVDIPISASCIAKGIKNDTAYLLNSNADLELFLTCPTNEINIDFNNNSLIVVNGWATSGISSITKLVTQVSEREYKLDINLYLNLTAEVPRWCVAILIPKIATNSSILLTINKKQ